MKRIIFHKEHDGSPIELSIHQIDSVEPFMRTTNEIGIKNNLKVNPKATIRWCRIKLKSGITFSVKENFDEIRTLMLN